MDLHQGSGVSGKRASPHLKHAEYDSQLRGHWQGIMRSIWIIWTLVNLVCFIAGIFAYRNLLQTTCVNTSQQQCSFWQLTPGNLQALAHAGLSQSAYVSYFLTVVIISSLIFWLVGLFIFWRRSNTWIGLFASFILVSFGAAGTSDILSTAFQKVYMLPAAVNMVLIALGSALWPLFGLFLLVFPDGRLRPRWSWIVLLLWMVQLVCFLLPPPLNILYWPSPLFVAELLLTYGSTVTTQIVRYLHYYDPMQRQQSKWLVFGLATCLLLNALYHVAGSVIPEWNHPDSLYLLADGTVTSLLFVAIPLAIGMAILRHRLWDIDLIINRSLVYAALTVCVIGGYTLTVVTLGTLLQRQGNLFISLFTTGLIALVFHPLRERLQRAANRLMYGERDDPYAVLSRLGSRMEATLAPDAVLPTIVETVALALKLPYASITVTRENTLNQRCFLWRTEGPALASPASLSDRADW